ncbi:MAG: hypothetical protein HN403_09985 [Rhodospirillales bacterium]|jgi:flagellar hook-associated protein 1|nr:hypothetical protein [Rhodospirillales bacterium]
MSIGSALSSAASGMAANARRVEVAADNLANVTTPGYAAKEVVAASIVTRGSTAQGYSAGGVRTILRSKASLSIASLELSNVDVADEYSRLIEARAAYRSSAEFMRTASSMLKEPVFG